MQEWKERRVFSTGGELKYHTSTKTTMFYIFIFGGWQQDIRPMSLNMRMCRRVGGWGVKSWTYVCRGRFSYKEIKYFLLVNG